MKFPALPLALMLYLALPTTSGFAARDTDDLFKEEVDRLRLQTEMPDQRLRSSDGPSTGMSSPKSGPQAEAQAPAVHAPNDPPADKPPSPAAPTTTDAPRTATDVPSFVRYLLWAIVIAGVPVILWSLRGSLQLVGRERKIVAREAVSLPSLEQSTRMMEARLEADDLAQQGRYGEAMHLLLLNSLSEMRRQLGISFAISLTSREILRRVQIADAGRHSLTAIIRSVERTHFGGEDAGQDDYRDCRTHFETLKQSLATALAA